LDPGPKCELNAKVTDTPHDHVKHEKKKKNIILYYTYIYII
jgi:hypothetical protein